MGYVIQDSRTAGALPFSGGGAFGGGALKTRWKSVRRRVPVDGMPPLMPWTSSKTYTGTMG